MMTFCYDEIAPSEVFPLSEFSPVPLTLEGSAVLHQFFRFDWKAWRALRGSVNATAIGAEAVGRARSQGLRSARSAIYSQLGHKADLIFIHFRDNFEQLNQVELDLAQTAILRLPRAAPFVCLGGRTGPV